MSTKTSIEWTDVTWNPVRGCSLKSAGCINCYAMKQAHRFSGKGQPYEGLTMIGQHGPSWTGKIQLVHELLDAPLHWKKPRRVFVNSMSDLFHEAVPFRFVHQAFTTIRQTPQHTYQILTKRPDRMRKFMAEYLRPREAMGWANGLYAHVWLGVSVENQQTADERIPLLLQTPAAVRWISAEPLLGPIDLNSLFMESGGVSALHGARPAWHPLDWVVVGGESGPHARPCDLAWIRSIKDQCQAAGVKCFVKQLGSNIAPVTVENGSVKERLFLKAKKGSDMAEWPEDLRVRDYPRVQR